MHNFNGNPFAFRQRRERIDWKKLASVDVEKVTRDVDFRTLQDNVANVTFCDIEAELAPDSLDPNFVKLFRLAQLIVEYLVHSQDCLSGTLANLEAQLAETIKQLEQLKDAEKVQKLRSKSAKTPAVPYVIVDNSSQHQCPHCPKAFLNQDYLNRHLQRRHPQRITIVPNHESAGANSKKTAEEEVEKQLVPIKERLDAAEARLKEERVATEAVASKGQLELLKREADLRQEVERWKSEQLDSHNKELQDVRDMFLNELKSLHEKNANSEKQLQELWNKADGKSNLGVLVDEEEINLEMLKKQQQEMERLKEQMHQQMFRVEDVVQTQLKEQEKLWKAKLKQLQLEHHSEMTKLAKQFETRVKDVSNPSVDEDPLELSLNRQIKELERMNWKKSNKLRKKENQLRALSNSSTPKRRPRSSQARSTKLDSRNFESTDERSRNQSMLSTRDEEEHESIAKIKSVIRHNPAIIQGMREEMTNLLQERLEQVGVARNASSVRDSSLSLKLADQDAERRGLSKKYPSLLSLREQFRYHVDKTAEKKMKTANKSLDRASFANGRKSFKNLYSSMKEKIRSVAQRSGSRSPSVPARRDSSITVVSPAAAGGRSGEITTLPYTTSSSGSEEEDDDEDARGDGKELSDATSSGSDDQGAKPPQPKPRITFDGAVRRSRASPTGDEWSDELSDTDVSSHAGGNAKSTKKVAATSPIPMPRSLTARSSSVPELAASIEKQLSHRATKPACGVDVLPGGSGDSRGRSSKPEVSSGKQAPSSNGLSSSLEEIFSVTSKSKPLLASKGDTENSSNTAATSVWGSSNSRQQQGAFKRPEAASRPSSSMVSISSWDSDEEIS